MELDSNLITLQSALRDAAKSTGDFTKIKYKGGNEAKICRVTKILNECLSKTLPDKDHPKYTSNVQDVLRFLIVNTNFEDDTLLNVKEYFHLIGIIPTFSKCLLANLIVGLKLTTCYSLMMPMLPLYLNQELLSEMVPCLQQCEPYQALNDTCTILSAVIKLLIPLDSQSQDEAINKFEDIFAEMLSNFGGLNQELIQNWKKTKIHIHMGYTFLSLGKLLKDCPLGVQHLSRIVNELIQIIVTVMKAVTIDVFLDWAEVEAEYNQSLQSIIAGEAYLLIEHLQKYKSAQELVQILASMARKPKSFQEIILEADTSTLISAIDKCDDNQKLWFRAFMNTNVLQTEESRACLDKWKNLCTKDDLNRLLSLSISQKDSLVKALVMECASCLNNEELASVVEKHFWEHSAENLKAESVKEELTVLLNKTQDNYCESFIRSIYLLLLQDPQLVLNTFYTECLKQTVQTQHLKSVFKEIKSAVGVHNLSKKVLIKTFESNHPTLDSIIKYKELFDALLDLGYFRDAVLITDVLTPQIWNLFSTNNYETMLNTLQVLNMISVKPILNEDTLNTFTLLINIVEGTRTELLTFSNTKQQISQECVNFIMKYTSQNVSSNLKLKDSLAQLDVKSALNKFYIVRLVQEEDLQLLTYVYPTLDFSNHPDVIAKLIKLLPLCVSSEWILIAKQVEYLFGYEKTLKLYYDVLILLCQFADTQLNTDNQNVNISSGLRFCLQQYGIIIKSVLQPKYNLPEDQKLLTKTICALMHEIPPCIRKEEGLKLMAFISNHSLIMLRNDREFVLSLIAIEEPTISQPLAQKMLV